MRSLVVGLEVAGVAQGKLEDQRHKWLSPPPLSLFLSSGFYLPALYSTGAETIRLHAYTSLGIFIPLSTFEGVPPRLCLSLIPYTSQTESLFCPSRPIRCLFSRVRVRGLNLVELLNRERRGGLKITRGGVFLLYVRLCEYFNQ